MTDTKKQRGGFQNDSEAARQASTDQGTSEQSRQAGMQTDKSSE